MTLEVPPSTYYLVCHPSQCCIIVAQIDNTNTTIGKIYFLCDGTLKVHERIQDAEF